MNQTNYKTRLENNLKRSNDSIGKEFIVIDPKNDLPNTSINDMLISKEMGDYGEKRPLLLWQRDKNKEVSSQHK